MPYTFRGTLQQYFRIVANSEQFGGTATETEANDLAKKSRQLKNTCSTSVFKLVCDHFAGRDSDVFKFSEATLQHVVLTATVDAEGEWRNPLGHLILACRVNLNGEVSITLRQVAFGEREQHDLRIMKLLLAGTGISLDEL